MNINHTSTLVSNKLFCSFLPDNRYPQNLELSLSIKGGDVYENFDRGFVDFHYQMFNGKKEIKRIMLYQKDFIFQPFRCKINTGDLISKISIGIYLRQVAPGDQYLVKALRDLEEGEISNSINFNRLKEVISHEPTFDFLGKIRAMNPQNFRQLLDRDLDALEALMDKGPNRVFNLWCLVDTIIKLVSSSKLPSYYLDMAVQTYFNEYADGKEALGFNNLINT
jgi:hypothetical protein